MSGALDQTENTPMQPHELEALLNDASYGFTCEIARWLATHDPEYLPQFRRLLDQRVDKYPLSADKTVKVFEALGVKRGRTTIRNHRSADAGCVDCQDLFINGLPSDS